jgi:hypothetical protein
MTTRRTERGFRIYSDFRDRNGKNVRVQASDLATERCVWVQIEGAAHLTVPMAKKVIKALQDFVDGKD